MPQFIPASISPSSIARTRCVRSLVQQVAPRRDLQFDADAGFGSVMADALGPIDATRLDDPPPRRCGEPGVQDLADDGSAVVVFPSFRDQQLTSALISSTREERPRRCVRRSKPSYALRSVIEGIAASILPRAAGRFHLVW